MFKRMYRKIVYKHFGGYKNFLLWLAAIALTIYIIDSYVLTKDNLENLLEESPDKPDLRAIPGVKVGDELEHHIPKDVGDKNPGAAAAKPAPVGKDDKKEDAEQLSKLIKPSGNCGLAVNCATGQAPYRLKSGYGRDGQPTICWNGEYIFSPTNEKGERGINMAIIDDQTHKVLHSRSFDTYTDDKAFARFLDLGSTEHQLLLLVSMDDMATSLSKEGRDVLEKHGAGKIKEVKFRDSYLLMGQRGAASGASLFEDIGIRGTEEFAAELETSGCIDLSAKKLANVETPDQGDPLLKRGQEAPRCGVKHSCGSDSFPVHLYSGIGNSEGPKICVSGKYVLARGLNDGGRGFNIVVVDPKTKDVVRVGHFDTYAEDSSNLEIFLEMMNEGEIVVALSHDDASKNLQQHAKDIFESLGSAMMPMMDFRDNYCLIGQKGIKDHSPFEYFETKDPASNWPVPIDKRVCVPTKIKGTKIKPDPMADKNEQKRKFCAKYDGYSDFCQADRLDEVLTPAPLVDTSLTDHDVFSIPIIIVPGLNHNALRMQLETLLLNPGINLDMVMILYDEKFDEPKALAKLFGFKAEPLSSSTKYVAQIAKALDKVWTFYRNARHVIVLEEEVVVGPDLLYLMSQCLAAVEADDTLIGITAWNVNGYQGVSGKKELVYRTQSIPGLAFLLKKSSYEKHMKKHMTDCCMKRSWDGWSLSAELEMLVPDTSRVYRRPYEGLAEDGDLMAELYNRERLTNVDGQVRIRNAAQLSIKEYDASITSLLSKSKALDTSNVEDCLTGKGLGFYVPETSGSVYSVYYEKSSATDYAILSRLVQCFKLFHSPGHAPRGLHKALLRFSYKDNEMLFVGSSSPFYKSMPTDYKPIKLSQL